MSARMTGMVFDRYPGGGGEMMLALALADHAHDDGSHIFPMVDSLAAKTRQSVRTVQYQLRKMQSMGWLQKDSSGDGGRGRATRYRINPAWIKGEEITPNEALDAVAKKGANIAPFSEPPSESKRVQSEAENGATAIAPIQKSRASKRVQSDALKGATAIAPAIEPYEPNTVIHPPTPQGAEPPDDEQVGQGSQRVSKPLTTFKAWVEDCRARGVKPIPAGDPVFALCETIGLGNDVLALHWAEFKRKRLASNKRQRNWNQTFQNSVRENWFRLWFVGADGRCELTTVGRQAQMLHEAAQRGEGDHA